MKSSLNQEKLEEIKDPAPGRKEYYDKSKGEITPLNQVGIVDPLTGLPVQQMTNVPPAPSNTLGQAQPVFNQQTQQNAQGMFGNQQALQNSVGATPMFKLDPMHDGKPGVQKEDFEQFKK
jgi:hypothetical protein